MQETPLTQQPSPYGVLLVNLGTPDKPETGAVRRYLREFLSDPRVVEIPQAVWFFILNGIILPLRAPKVAKAYAGIWEERGSPLRVITADQAKALDEQLQSGEAKYRVDYAMTYGNPSIAERIDAMRQSGIEKILVLPLYPQYSATTTAAVFDKLNRHLSKVRNLPEVRFVKSYFDVPEYIAALASSIREYRAEHGNADKLIFSFHGIPKRCVDKGDPYYVHCRYTAEQTAKQLGLQDGEWLMTFQSRFGAEEWLQPYTDETLKKLPSEGIKTVQVVCPAFAADCLETLEEISVENAHIFSEAGGERLDYIPALNCHPEHIALLRKLVLRHTENW